MKVSVIVPLYNREKYLRECVDSILRQTHTDLDIILVDDGSTDSSPAICDEYAANDSRVRVLHTPYTGQSVARNVGTEHAQADYVMYVDSDDMIHPRCVSTLVELIERYGAAAASCEYTRTAAADMSCDGVVRCYDPMDAIGVILYQRGLNNSLWGKILPRQAAVDNKQAPGILYEDLDAFYRIYESLDGAIATTTAPMYYYRRTPDSILSHFDRQRLDVLDVVDRIEQHYADNASLRRAARDRKFSANYNMFLLCSDQGLAADADRCWQVIRRYRWSSLTDKRVRPKNRVGALVSYLGNRATRAINRILRLV